jgi:hypothetical protein
MSTLVIINPSQLDPSFNDVLNLVQLLLTNLNTPSYNLSQDQIYWINQFINASPASFAKVDADVTNLISDGKIGLQSIPQLVKICADIYSSGAISSNMVNSQNTIALIKFTLEVILTSQLIVMSDDDKEAIKRLVDISLSLLSMNIDSVIDSVETSKCFVGFLNLFKCK